LQVVYPADEVPAALTAPGLEGNYTAEAALTALLKNTGLTFQYLNDRTVAVMASGKGSRTAGAQTRSAKPGKDDSPPAGPDATKSALRIPRHWWQRFVQSPSGNADASQGEKDQEGKLETITVTARRREENLQQVPVSIVALTGTDIENKSLDNLL